MQIWSTSGALCAGGVRRCNALRGRARILGLTNFPPSSSVHFICLRTSIILSRWFLRPLIVKILQLPIVYPLTAHFHAQSTSITPLRYAAALELSADALSLAPSPRCPPNSHTTCEIAPLRDAFPMAGERYAFRLSPSPLSLLRIPCQPGVRHSAAVAFVVCRLSFGRTHHLR